MNEQEAVLRKQEALSMAAIRQTLDDPPGIQVMGATLAIVEKALRAANSDREISIHVAGENYIGCQIMHLSATVDEARWYAERVLVVGDWVRPEPEQYPLAITEMYEFFDREGLTRDLP